jgi:hypothetical protein
MMRAISVVVAVLVLLVVGWYFGQRPASGLKKDLAAQGEECAKRLSALEERALQAEARGWLWAAHAELLLAANDVERRNFGTAGERVARARDRITQAAGVVGNPEELGRVRDVVGSISALVAALDPEARELLLRAAAELERLLERVGQA